MQLYSFLQDNGDGGVGDDGDQLYGQLIATRTRLPKKAKTATIPLVTQHIPTMKKNHHGGQMSVMIKVGKCQ